MAVSAQEMGRRLRTAREACGMTQEDVARRLGVSRPTVAQMELGNRAVTSLELDKLAHLFGRDIREFVAERIEEEDALAALFRAEPEIANHEDVADSLRACLALGREVTNIEYLLGIDRDLAGAVSYQVVAPRSRWEAIQQGERAAEQERRRLGLGWAPSPPLPELLETQGVRTGVVDLPEEISGLTISNQSVGLFIVANRGHAPPRRRFSFAHEYAHLLFDSRLMGIVTCAADRDELIEVRANAFAAAFLMPPEGMRQFVAALGKGQPSRAIAQVFDEAGAVQAEGRAAPCSQDIQLYDVVHLAQYFGVSRLAALFRLRNLKLVTQAEDPNRKLDPGKRSHWTIANREIDEIVSRVNAARERIGPEVELALECHTRYETETAIQIGRAVASARPMWLEEPVPSDNLEAMALVRRSVPVPIACGENVYTRYGFRQVIEKQAAAIIQPDMTKYGGLLETRKIASLAEIYHIPIAPHGTASPLAGMAYAHVCATVPNFLILEFGHLLREKSAPLRGLVKSQPQYENGFVQVPDGPGIGIGIEVNDDANREHLRPGFRWS